MKYTHTIITILFLALLWFFVQRFFYNQPVVTPTDYSGTTEQVENTDSVEIFESDLADLNTDEQALDQDLDELEAYSF